MANPNTTKTLKTRDEIVAKIDQLNAEIKACEADLQASWPAVGDEVYARGTVTGKHGDWIDVDFSGSKTTYYGKESTLPLIHPSDIIHKGESDITASPSEAAQIIDRVISQASKNASLTAIIQRFDGLQFRVTVSPQNPTRQVKNDH